MACGSLLSSGTSSCARLRGPRHSSALKQVTLASVDLRPPKRKGHQFGQFLSVIDRSLSKLKAPAAASVRGICVKEMLTSDRNIDPVPSTEIGRLAIPYFGAQVHIEGGGWVKMTSGLRITA